MKLFQKLAAALIVVGLGLGTANAAPPCPPAAPVVLYPTPAPLPAPPQFFGSEAYYQAHGGDPQDFVSALFSDVLHRPPSEAETQRWVSRLSACGDGVTMAREFLTFAQGELAAQAAAAPPIVVLPPQAPPSCFRR
jgi:hypothetical protein